MTKKTVTLGDGKEVVHDDVCAICKRGLSDDPNSPRARHLVVGRLVCRADVPKAIEKWEPQPA